MSHFKADTTIASLSLFPRSRITEIREDDGNVLRISQICVFVVMMCGDAANQPERISLVVWPQGSWLEGFRAV